MPDYILAIDQGTTSTRAIVFDAGLAPVGIAQEEFPQYLSGARLGRARSGGNLVARRSRPCVPPCAKAGIAGAGRRRDRHHQPARDHGHLGPRDRQADPQGHRLAGPPHRRHLRGAAHARAMSKLIAARTGLLLDPYFSATKIAWLLDHVAGARAAAEAGRLAFGTVDSFLIWRLTGGKVHATDATNAARTLLFDIRTRRMGPTSLLSLFRVPRAMLPEVRDCAGEFGTTEPDAVRRRRSAFAAWPATSRRRPSGRAASRPA